MSEQIPDMEKLAWEEEIGRHVAETSVRIEHRMDDIAQQSTDAAKEVGLMDALGKVAKEAQSKALALTWKDAKAMIAAGVSLVPLAGTLPGLAKTAEAAKDLSAAGKAAKAAEKVGKAGWELTAARAGKEIAQNKLWRTVRSIPGHAAIHMVEPGLAMRDIAGKGIGLAKDAVISRTAVEGSKQALKEAVKKGAPSIGIRGLEWAMRTVDPFPDVPPVLSTVAGVTSLFLPGADIVPALWQLVHNKVKWAETYGKMALDMGEVVANRLNRDYVQVKQPEVARAAAAFPVPVAG